MKTTTKQLALVYLVFKMVQRYAQITSKKLHGDKQLSLYDQMKLSKEISQSTRLNPATCTALPLIISLESMYHEKLLNWWGIFVPYKNSFAVQGTKKFLGNEKSVFKKFFFFTGNTLLITPEFLYFTSLYDSIGMKELMMFNGTEHTIAMDESQESFERFIDATFNAIPDETIEIIVGNPKRYLQSFEELKEMSQSYADTLTNGKLVSINAPRWIINSLVRLQTKQIVIT